MRSHNITHHHQTTTTTTGLKAQGKYLARTLSFADTSFQIQQVPLAGEFKAKYDTLAQVWYEVLEIMHEAGNDLQRGNARYKGANQLAYQADVKDHLKMFSGQYWGG